jgi:predicted TIM-barrel fold metal-dependent hydrolase
MHYNVISTDDHLQEAPHTWTSRMSKARWSDLIPQIRRDPDGTDHWYIHGAKIRGGGVGSVRGIVPVGKPPLTWDEVPPKAYQPAARIKAMDEDGVDVHTFFGNISGVAGNTFSDPAFDEDYRLDAIRAYNDYQIEEWATPYPGRFITLCNLPMWDVDRAVAELQRTARLGIKGVAFAFPEQWGYPSIDDAYWYPLWAAAQDAELSINFHVGSGASMGLAKLKPLTTSSPMIFLSLVSTRAITANVEVMTTILFSGILEKFPRLQVVSSESGIGWVPYLLEVADHQWEAQDLRNHGMRMRPSEYFHRQCYVNFWFEELGPSLRHLIGLDNIMWESDFPHGTGTYPHSREKIEKATRDWTEAERRRVLVETPRRLYHLG